MSTEIYEAARAVIVKAVRSHCTPSSEAYRLGGDRLIAAVADWIENPPEWVKFDELNGTWIDHAGLPEVVQGGPTDLWPHGRLTAGPLSRGGDLTADEAHREALAYFALARHLRANPPVDERQVEALHDLLYDVVDVADVQDKARRLIATGKVRVDVKGAGRG